MKKPKEAKSVQFTKKQHPDIMSKINKLAKLEDRSASSTAARIMLEALDAKLKWYAGERE